MQVDKGGHPKISQREKPRAGGESQFGVLIGRSQGQSECHSEAIQPIARNFAEVPGLIHR